MAHYLLARKYLENMSNQTGNINIQSGNGANDANVLPLPSIRIPTLPGLDASGIGWSVLNLILSFPNVPAYLLSLLAVFALSALYEAIRVGRALLFRVEEASQSQQVVGHLPPLL